MVLQTEYIKINRDRPEMEIIQYAAKIIQEGNLLAFPTETVYGLGASALNPQAVAEIFKAKGRPPQTPLLVHVSSLEQVETLAEKVPAEARELMACFWPGPLSIILPASPVVPEIVRGGKQSVGFRMPSHPVSRALIETAGPIAAPSANLYGRPSPTNSQHVKMDLDGKIFAVLDAGETGAGLESTIIDLSSKPYQILRRGGIAVEEIIPHISDIEIAVNINEKQGYETSVKVELSKDRNDYLYRMRSYLLQKEEFAVVLTGKENKDLVKEHVRTFNLDIFGEENSFYSILREAEQKGINILLFEPLEEQTGGTAAAMLDRIKRAARGK